MKATKADQLLCGNNYILVLFVACLTTFKMLVAYIQYIQQNQVHTPAAVLDKITPTVISLL